MDVGTMVAVIGALLVVVVWFLPLPKWWAPPPMHTHTDEEITARRRAMSADETPDPPRSQPVSIAPRRRSFGVVWLMVCVVAAVGGYLYLTRPRFTDADISDVRRAIEVKFNERAPNSVREVVIMRRSDTQLVGFVKLMVLNVETSRSCTAEMDRDGSNYYWQCN